MIRHDGTAADTRLRQLGLRRLDLAASEAEGRPEVGRLAVGWRAWVVALALITPAAIPYLTHYFMAPAGTVPTGFIVWDMPYYMANAREHFDNGGFSPLYGNPSSHRYNTDRIYVQPMTLLLGTIWRLTGFDPGAIIAVFGLFAAWGCSRVAMALYAQVVGLRTGAQWLGLVAFGWGGGVLAIAGAVANLIARRTIDDPLVFDPSRGFWFLNFGRNLMLPTEALYHGLAFGAVLLVLRGRTLAAAVVAAVLSASHPFTGIEFLAILAAWSVAEVYYFENPAVPRRFARIMVALLAVHVGYYLLYLRTSAEHRLVMEHWTQYVFLLGADAYLPAYAIVGGLAAWQLRRSRLAGEFFARPGNRLLAAWAAIAFALAKHDAFFKAVQPIHFDHGYVWTALFLIGAGPLVRLFGHLTAPGRRRWGVMCVAVLMAVILSDNAVFLGAFPVKAARDGAATGMVLPRTMRELYRWLDAPENRGRLVLAEPEVEDIGYLTTVYTPLRAWIGHPSNTPGILERRAEQSEFFRLGRMPDYWRTRPLLVIFLGRTDQTLPAWLPGSGAALAYRNDPFRVYRIDPTLRVADRRHRRTP